MNDFWQDLRQGVRQLVGNPSFTLVALATLAIGIGANTAIFSVVEAVLLRPFPYREPGRLMILWERNIGLGFPAMFVAPPNYADWAEQTESFESLAAFTTTDVTLALDAPERVREGRVSSSLFTVLGVRPVEGRGFTPAEDAPGAGQVVVLSHGFAERRFGGQADVLGRQIIVDGEPHSIVGVMPPGFAFPPPIALEGDLPADPVEIWVPLALDYASGQRGAHYLNVIGRLAEGVEIETARTEMNAIAAGIAEVYPASSGGWDTKITPLAEQVTANVRPALVVLLAAVAFVLLIACVNVANLLLTRGVARNREMALRAALGAGRRRLLTQLLAESLLLSGLGGIAGLLVAFFGVRGLVAIAPPNLPRLWEVRFDLTTAAFTAAVCLVSAIVFGSVPALQTTSRHLFDGLRGRDALASRGRGLRLGHGLVVAEIALALALLVGAALVVRSFSNLRAVDPGFRPAEVVTIRTTLPRSRYGEPEARIRFLEHAIQELEALSEVELAGAINEMPLADDRQGTSVTVEGGPEFSDGQEPQTAIAVVSRGYFDTLGIPVKRGRDFDERDRAEAPGVVVVNEALAKRYVPNADPIGRRLRLGMSSQTPWQIVGVVGDVRHRGLATDAVPNAYLAYSQLPRSYGLTFTLRTYVDAARVVPPARDAVRRLDPAVPLYEVQPLEGILDQTLSGPRFSARLLALFAVSAVLLASIGLYGVTSYTVSQRIPEMGLRVALGAAPAEIARLVVSTGARLGAIGITIGLIGSLALTRLLSTLLFGVSAQDPLSFALVAALLFVVALFAAYLPARRAARVDPVVALRSE